jgi:hypothetical protein
MPSEYSPLYRCISNMIVSKFYIVSETIDLNKKVHLDEKS